LAWAKFCPVFGIFPENANLAVRWQSFLHRYFCHSGIMPKICQNDKYFFMPAYLPRKLRSERYFQRKRLKKDVFTKNISAKVGLAGVSLFFDTVFSKKGL